MRVELTIDTKQKELIIRSSVTLDEVMKLLEELGLKEKGYKIRFEPKETSGSSLPSWRAFSVPCVYKNWFKVTDDGYVTVEGPEEEG